MDSKSPASARGLGADVADRSFTIETADFDAAVFDLDGVITRTATVHAAAWKDLFDDFLKRRAVASGEPFRPFDIQSDYQRYVDGKPRYDGVRSFLASRDIVLPEGAPGDPTAADTVRGLGQRKDRLFLKRLAQHGVEVFESSATLVRALRRAGLKTAVASSSRNAGRVLAAAGLRDLFDVLVDGVEAERLKLNGKPSPDVFLYAAKRLGVPPARALGFEDALAGVQAIHAAGYALAIGVDRSDQRQALLQHGADIVVDDLGQLQISKTRRHPRTTEPSPPLPPAVRTADPAWLLVEEGFNPHREHEIESIFAIANGHLGSRASLAEGSAMSSPATYVAGLFDPEPGPTPALASLVDWARLSVATKDGPLALDAGVNLEHRRILDLRQGVLWREWRHQGPSGQITAVRELRLASQSDRQLLLQSVAVTPENYDGAIEIDATLSDVVSHRTSQGCLVSTATASRLTGPGDQPLPEVGPITLQVRRGETCRLDRVVAVAATPGVPHPRRPPPADGGARPGRRGRRDRPARPDRRPLRGLAVPVGGERRRRRGRRGRSTGAALRRLSPAERSRSGRRQRLDRRARPDRPGL